MGILRRLEEIAFTGRRLKDYGQIGRRGFALGSETVSALLTEKKLGRRLVLRIRAGGLGAVSVRYVEFDRDEVATLAAVIEDALPLMGSGDTRER